MGQMAIKIYPDPCLRIKSKPVDRFEQDLADVLREMAELMYRSQGIGLAAPQVGLGLSVLVVDTGDKLINYINPVILDRSKERAVMEEGCLSLPGLTVNVKRPARIKVRAQDANGGFFVSNLEGLAARAVQHEIDHLNGRMIIDHLDPFRRFIAGHKLVSAKRLNAKKTCEVVCNAGK